MDKEKEIQEIADSIGEWASARIKIFGNASVYDPFAAENLGKNLYEEGYRKADEVRTEVLDEFYNTHYCGYMQAYDDEVKEPCVQGPCPHFKGVEDIRKETAKEILEIVNHYQHYTWNDFTDIIKDICNKYGVEIDE